jgi:serine/threonine protein phosphatase PrpC
MTPKARESPIIFRGRKISSEDLLKSEKEEEKGTVEEKEEDKENGKERRGEKKVEEQVEEQVEDKERKEEEIIHTNDAVSNIPEYMTRVVTEEDEFVMIGSDGLWDVIPSKDAVKLARHYVAQGTMTMEEIAKKVVEAAVERGTDDNTTLLIIRLR